MPEAAAGMTARELWEEFDRHPRNTQNRKMRDGIMKKSAARI